MEDLFERLKSEPEVGKYNKNFPALSTPKKHNKKSNSPESDSGKKSSSKKSTGRRESMPPPSSQKVLKKSQNKSRSLSPPRSLALKKFVVKVQRTSLEDLREKKVKTPKRVAPLKPNNTSSSNSNSSNSKENKNTENPIQKYIPTKAQKKLFDPAVLIKAQKLKNAMKIKKCYVHIRRDNLLKLRAKAAAKRKASNKNKNTTTKPSTPKVAEKRKSNSQAPSTPPSKKSKPNNKPTNFFIKLTSPSILDKKAAQLKKNKEKQLSQKAQILAAKQAAITKPTKFSRSHLLKNFDKRFFRSHVKIERCTHPMMLIFESNAKARKLQAKQNKKSKNLSVSFKEQVEIFGVSDSDESDDETDFINASTMSNISASSSFMKSPAGGQGVSGASTSTPMVMPARLKKVENGKVIDDIEFDPALFIDPKAAGLSPERKRKDRKSFSPLKGDGTPSPRKEKLKMANEKLPPNGLRRLNIDDVDEDDSDDEDEYIGMIIVFELFVYNRVG